MDHYAAYIDESGNHDLDIEKSGASNYFIILAILIPKSDVDVLETAVEAIREKYFGVGEMKSSNVKNDRRVKIINDLKLLNFKFYAVAIDKARVAKDSGLAYKRSFVKFANGRLYSALFQNIMNLSVFADGHGNSDFIEGFKLYVEDNHKPDLFSKTNIQIVDSRNQVLVQLADFLVGTTAKLYEEKVSGEFKNVFLEFLRSKKIRIDEWPPKYEIHSPALERMSESDSEVRSIALRAAAVFLDGAAVGGDIEEEVQRATLSYLLFHAMFPIGDEFISTQEIIDHLNFHGFSNINSHYLRSNVVSKLRDRNVVIASSSRGYKIPTTYSDVIGFADLVDGIVSPLLARLERADGIFDLGSAGKIKILNEGRFNKLRLMLAHLDGKA